MRQVLVFILLTVLVVTGCGGGDDNCDFEFSSFLNGQDERSQTSEWDCVTEENHIFSFAAFEDGTGFSTDVGVFTYQQTGCRRAAFQSEFGSGDIVDIQGSRASGVLTFTQISDDLGDVSAFCVLDTNPEDTI